MVIHHISPGRKVLLLGSLRCLHRLNGIWDVPLVSARCGPLHDNGYQITLSGSFNVLVAQDQVLALKYQPLCC